MAYKKAANTTPVVPAGLEVDQLDVAVTVSRRTYIGTLLIPHSLLSLRAEEMVQNSSALGHGGLCLFSCSAPGNKKKPGHQRGGYPLAARPASRLLQTEARFSPVTLRRRLSATLL